MAEEPCNDSLLAQHERALSLLCGLHTCITIDGPPETVAERVFDQVLAERRQFERRIAVLEKELAGHRANFVKKQEGR
jgi:hypothetical protein